MKKANLVEKVLELRKKIDFDFEALEVLGNNKGKYSEHSIKCMEFTKKYLKDYLSFIDEQIFITEKTKVRD